MKRQAATLMRTKLQENFSRNRYVVYLFLGANLVSILLILFLGERVAAGPAGWFLFFTAFLWLGAIVFGGTALLNYMEGRRLTASSIEDYLQHTPQSRLHINEEAVEYVTGEQSLRYTWQDFSRFFEKKGTLYLVPGDDLLKAFYFSAEDIGEEAYSLLSTLAAARVR